MIIKRKLYRIFRAFIAAGYIKIISLYQSLSMFFMFLLHLQQKVNIAKLMPLIIGNHEMTNFVNVM